MIKSNVSCHALAFVRLEDETHGQSIRTTARISFELKSKDSKLDMIFFSPFGTRAGRLQLDKHRSVWRDTHAEYDVRQHPILGKWYQTAWWSEFAFIFGILTRQNQAFVKIDKMGHLRTFENSERQIHCTYKKSGSEKICNINVPEISGSFELKDLTCSEPYET